jgi:integrase
VTYFKISVLMQKGYIFQHRKSWYCRYYLPSSDGMKKCCKRLGAIAEFPTRKSVEHLAARLLRPVNERTIPRQSSTTVLGFIENVYLPHAKLTLRFSTYKDYSKDIFQKHLRSRLGGIYLHDFRTVNGQKILDDIAQKNVGVVNHKTLLRIKSFLSGVFKHARQTGYLDSENPMRDTKCAGRPQKFVGQTYGSAEVKRMIKILPEPARTVVALAAMTGLRHSEIRGLRWSDYEEHNNLLHVRRALWRTHIQETKTESSEDSVPVLPALRLMLYQYRYEIKPKSDSEYMFAGPRRGTSLNLANLVRRVIVPAFAKAEPPLVWKGWHAFRRSLGTYLYSAGVSPKVIAGILRHADIGTTLQYYIKPMPEEIREGIEKVAKDFPFSIT